MSRARPKGYIDWQPRAKSAELLKQVRAVLIEYANYLPLTVRQIFYRLVGVHGYPKDENAYGRLGNLLVNARRSRRISFDDIRDDGVTWQRPRAWQSAKQLIDSIKAEARGFRLDRQKGQPCRLFLGIEAAGMVPQISRLADPYGIAVFSSSGFDSLTLKHDLGRELAGYPEPVEVLHVGDYDESGESIFDVLAEDVPLLGEDSSVRFSRLAVTPEQIAALRLPTASPKPKDKRGKGITATTQAEAIPPDVLAQIVQEAIIDRLDDDAYQTVLEEELKIRRSLARRLGGIA